LYKEPTNANRLWVSSLDNGCLMGRRVRKYKGTIYTLSPFPSLIMLDFSGTSILVTKTIDLINFNKISCEVFLLTFVKMSAFLSLSLNLQFQKACKSGVRDTQKAYLVHPFLWPLFP
jgi:hypothetical protein